MARQRKRGYKKKHELKLTAEMMENFTFSSTRDALVMKLKSAGKDHFEIAERLKTTPDKAQRWVREAIARFNAIHNERAEELTQIEVVRLNMMQDAIWEKAMLGSLPEIRQAAAIIQQRCDLLGLSAMVPVVVNNIVNQHYDLTQLSDEELMEMRRMAVKATPQLTAPSQDEIVINSNGDEISETEEEATAPATSEVAEVSAAPISANSPAA